MTLRPKYLRTRLTLLYVSVLAGLLILAWGGTIVLQFWQLRSQLDHFAIEEIDFVDDLFFFTQDGKLRLREEYRSHPEPIDRFIEVRSPEGSVLYKNERLGVRSMDGMLQRSEGVKGYSERSSRLSDGTPIRLVSEMFVVNGRRVLIRLGYSEEPMRSRLKDLVLASLLVLPLVLVTAGFAGYTLAGRALSPIDQMVRRAREITPEHLHERLPNQDVDDELGRLALVFNEMLSRLELAFNQLRRFTSDCSHDLRTPLAMIRSVGEVGLRKNATGAEYRDTIGSMLEEVNSLTSLVDTLLTIARADSGHLQLQRTVVPVIAVAREAASLFEVLMEEKSLRLVLGGNEHAEVDGDPLILKQAMANIIDNAVKYSPAGETISVWVWNGDSNLVSVEIQDHGPGIPPEDRDKVFDRFYRVDKARWRQSGGAGLGLAIAKWAVEAHGGSIDLRTETGQGCTFCITLPCLHS